MADGKVIESAELEARLKKNEEEMLELQNALTRHDRKIKDALPIVQEYNERLRSRKELRRALAAKQKQLSVLAEFLQGTTLIDSRFPLFAQQQKDAKSSAG